MKLDEAEFNQLKREEYQVEVKLFVRISSVFEILDVFHVNAI